MRKLFKVCLVLALACSIAAAPTVYRGYQLYKTAVEKVPLEEKVSEIRERDDYVPLSEISDYFVEEIIKSEDKRFSWHFGIDPLAIA